MTESQHSDDASFLNESIRNPIQPIGSTQAFKKNPVFYNSKINTNRSTNKFINVLYPNKSTNKLEYAEDFQDFLSQDEANSNLNIVTVIGSKQIGKSFLIDLIISKEEKSSSRALSKNGKAYINIPTYDMRGRNGQKIIFFDTNEEIPNEAFIWSYFLSSAVVLNLTQVDKKGQDQFLKRLTNLGIGLVSEQQDLSLPQLIILRRDSNTKQFKDSEFIDQIKKTGFFQPEIISLNMAYPGNSTVGTKDVKDVAESLLNESFIKDAENFSRIIKSVKVKTIKGNYLVSKIAGLTLEPLTKSINKNGKAITNSIWNDVIETLSVGYYNFYIKKYAEELQEQFKDEEPSDKYTLYKKLSKVRRNIDKKVEGFNNIAGDPTFQKYKQKLQQKINSKEKVIKQINKQKSIQKNDELAKKLFADMNDSNCEALIQKYCESKLDDNKTEVLLDNFEIVIKKRLQQMQKSKNPQKKQSLQIQELQKELKRLEDQIKAEKEGNVNVVAYDFNKIKKSIEQKQKQVKQLEFELDKQKKLSSDKQNNQNKDIVQLQTNIEKLKARTKEQEKQIQKLKADREASVQQTVANLKLKLKDEEEKYQRLQDEIKKAQQVSVLKSGSGEAKGASKDTCCNIM